MLHFMAIVVFTNVSPKIGFHGPMQGERKLDNTQKILSQAESLYDATAKLIYNMALYMTGSPSNAKKIATEAFCKAFYSSKDKEDIDLFQIRAITLIYRYGKKRNNGIKTKALVLTEQETHGVKRPCIAQMLEQLCPQDRFIVLAFCWQRYSIDQISRMILRPAALTRKRLNSALCKSAGFLADAKSKCHCKS